jgi:hypothetical protein
LGAARLKSCLFSIIYNMKFFLYSSALLLSSVSQYLLPNEAFATSLHTPDQPKETIAAQPSLPVVSSSAALADELRLLDSTEQQEQAAVQHVSWRDASSVNIEKTAQPQPADLTNANANEQLEFPGDSLELSQRRRPTRVSPARRRPVVQPTVPINQPAQVTPEAPSQDRGEDWATTALRSLATRYNCSAAVLQSGRQLTRNEFASGLLDCIDKMEEVITNRASGSLQANSSVQEDLANLSALQQEFASELATLIIRLDQKADRSSQFSTTTKLAGEIVFALADTFGDRNSSDPTVPVFGYRARLNFNGSTNGKDQFRIRLQVRDVPQFSGGASTGTNMTRLGFDGVGTVAGVGTTFTVDDFFYKFPLFSDQTRVTVVASGYGTDNFATHFSPISSSGRGALSRFARYSPVYRQLEGPGVGVEHSFSDQFNASLVYRTQRATNSAPGNGLFNGSYGALAQLTYRPTPTVGIGLQYVNSYYSPTPGATAGTFTSTSLLAGSTGSSRAQNPFNSSTAIQANTFGIVGSYSISPQFLVSGWAGFTEAQGTRGTDNGKNASIAHYLVTLGFPDLFQKGNFGAISFGMPPKLTSSNGSVAADTATSLHIEASYRHQLTDNLAITPGFFVITNPEHNASNPTQVVGVIRTTLSF